MGYSSFQVQRLMTRLRRARQAAQTAPAAAPEQSASAPGPDLVRLSRLAQAQAAETAEEIRLPPGAPVTTASIVDREPVPLPTRIELERRAGSFMRPPHPPSPGPLPIPRARRAITPPADSAAPTEAGDAEAE